jgi:hypothetical protein
MDTRSEKQIHREFLADLKRVDGKLQILSRVAEAVVEKPDGIVREVIFSRVKEEVGLDSESGEPELEGADLPGRSWCAEISGRHRAL